MAITVDTDALAAAVADKLAGAHNRPAWLAEGLTVKALYTVAEVAQALGCSGPTVRRAITAGAINAATFGTGATLMVPFGELERIALGLPEGSTVRTLSIVEGDQ